MSEVSSKSQSIIPPGEVKTPVIEERFHKAMSFTWQIAACDIIAAAITAGCTSTIVSIIDKSIMEKTLGIRPTIKQGLKDGITTLFTKPQRFFLVTSPPNNFAPVYRLVFLTYSTTYAAGNVVQSYRESQNKPFYLEKFTAGSVANVAITLYKDNAMLNILPLGAKTPVPNLSRFLFICRDSITVLASFWVAPLFRDFLQRKTQLTYKQASDAADLSIPASLQLVTTPMHLYGISLKANPRATFAEHAKVVRRDFAGAVCSRFCRIMPAFGFGMMAMKRMRSQFQESVEGPNPPPFSRKVAA